MNETEKLPVFDRVAKKVTDKAKEHLQNYNQTSQLMSDALMSATPWIMAIMSKKGNPSSSQLILLASQLTAIAVAVQSVEDSSNSKVGFI